MYRDTPISGTNGLGPKFSMNRSFHSRMGTFHSQKRSFKWAEAPVFHREKPWIKPKTLGQNEDKLVPGVPQDAYNFI